MSHISHVSPRALALRVSRVVGLSTMALCTLFGPALQTAQAISRKDLNSIVNNTAFYDPTATAEVAACGAGGSGPTTPTTGVKDFVDKYGQMAYDSSLTTGVPYEFVLGQAMNESGHSDLAFRYNNFFGIKADSSWTGTSIQLPTQEFQNGAYITIMASFRTYPTAAAGFADHDQFFIVNKRYAPAFQYSNDPIGFLNAIAAAGYATSPTYAKDIIPIINEVQGYVASTGKWPPSSKVVYALASTPTSPTSGGSVDACSTATTTSDLSAYKNPVRDIQNLTPLRIDEGVDYSGTGPVYAMGNGTVIEARNGNSGWPGGYFVAYRLADGPAVGKVVFFAEHCPLAVSVGDQVTSTTVICNMQAGYPYTETGWAEDSTTSGQAAAHIGYTPDGTATAFGQNYNDLLVKLGAPHGTYDFAAQQGGKNLTGSLPSGWPSW